MTSLRIVGTAYVNNGDGVVCELGLDQEIHTQWSTGPRPDNAWSFVDRAGHFHAYDQADERRSYPTLHERSRAVPCDGSCGGVCGGEGYSVVEFFCRICEEQVEPGLIPGPYSFTVPGLKSWRVDAQASVEGDLVSIRLETEKRTYFGVAQITSSHMGSDLAGARTTLTGWGELGSQVKS